MKKQLWMLVPVAAAIALLIALTSKPHELMIDDFEGKLSNETVDYGSAEGSSVKVSADNTVKVSGKQSMKIEYDLKPSGYMWIARGYKLDVKGAAQWLTEPENIPWKKFNAIKLSMKGTNNGGVVALDIKDSGGEIWRCLLDDDSKEWKDVVIPFSQFFARKDWQPDAAAKNDVLDFPIRSFQFEPRLPGTGVYNFDAVKAVKVKDVKK